MYASRLLAALQGGGGAIEGWQDVGGLADVRAALQEALELPTKYASLIARSPLLAPAHPALPSLLDTVCLLHLN